MIIDTTVQIKNIKHPHDVYLMESAREKVVDLCKRLGIRLNETYAKTFKYKMIKLWKYKEDSKARQRRKIMISLKVRLGRLIRICQRAIEKSKLERKDIDYLAILHIKRSGHAGILEALGLNENQTIYLEEYGHIGQIDQILSLHLALEQKKVKDGSIVCMLAAGIGYVWAANIIRWGDVNV